MKRDTSTSKKPAGVYFLAAVAAIYTAIALFAPHKAADALSSSLSILWKLLPVIVIVIVLLGFFNRMFNAASVARHLGKVSGPRAWLIAISGGILSHGPAFVWYPMLAELRHKGVRDGFIVAFFYVRAIKLPWMPVMIDYFGWSFTAALTLALITAALIQGLIVEYFASAELH